MFPIIQRPHNNPPPFLARGFAVNFKTHASSKKRFRPKPGGKVTFRPAGRQHGMHRHSRDRNRSKGQKVMIEKGENGALWHRLQGLNIDVRPRMKLRGRKLEAPKIIKYKWNSSFLENSTSYDAILANNMEQVDQIVGKFIKSGPASSLASTKQNDFVPLTKLPTPKKVQWRVAKA